MASRASCRVRPGRAEKQVPAREPPAHRPRSWIPPRAAWQTPPFLRTHTLASLPLTPLGDGRPAFPAARSRTHGETGKDRPGRSRPRRKRNSENRLSRPPWPTRAATRTNARVTSHICVPSPPPWPLHPKHGRPPAAQASVAHASGRGIRGGPRKRERERARRLEWIKLQAARSLPPSESVLRRSPPRGPSRTKRATTIVCPDHHAAVWGCCAVSALKPAHTRNPPVPRSPREPATGPNQGRPSAAHHVSRA